MDIKCRLEEHVLRNHVPLEEVPFFCSLCLFKSQQKQQIISHFSSCKRHKDMAAKRGVTDSMVFLVESQKPYKFGSLDLVQLSAEESLNHFMKQSVSRTATESSNQVSVTLNQMFPDLFLEDGHTPAPVTAQATSVQAETLPDIQPPEEVMEVASPVSAAPVNIQPIQQIAQMLAATPLGHLLNTQSAMVASMKESVSGLGVTGPEEKRSADPDVPVVAEETAAGEVTVSTEEEVTQEELVAEEGARENVENSKESEVDEDITDQLLNDQNMSLSPCKRVAEDDEDPFPPNKVQRTEVDEHSNGIDIEKVNQATVVAAIGSLTEMMRKTVAAVDRMERFMVDNTCVMAKMAAMMSRLNETMEESQRREVQREEVRQEFDRRRDEERRREISRWRRQEERHAEEERRRADRRREQERRDRQDRWREERRSDKENQPRIKSVLGVVSNSNNSKSMDEGRKG
ncbi:MAG: hypothetical protein AB2693_18720 [Candidatus Thiodiazotropha sp.]